VSNPNSVKIAVISPSEVYFDGTRLYTVGAVLYFLDDTLE